MHDCCTEAATSYIVLYSSESDDGSDQAQVVSQTVRGHLLAGLSDDTEANRYVHAPICILLYCTTSATLLARLCAEGLCKAVVMPHRGFNVPCTL